MNKKILFIGLFLFISLYSFSQTKVEAESYTAMSGVSTENAWGDGGGTDVGWIDLGDWMDFAIHPTVTGVHTFIFRLATSNAAAQFKVKKSDGTVLATVNVPNTGGFQQWQSLAVQVNLTAGDQTIRIESTAADIWNFNWFEYSFGYKMEAELYSTMSGVGTEQTTDAGGGQDVGYVDDSDWMDYPVNIEAAGVYSLKLRVSSPNDGRELQIKNSNGTALMTVNVPNTGDYQNWQTVDTTISLSAGQQTLRIYATNGWWNINWWALVPSVVNQNPVAGAGSDTAITLPTNTVSLSGSGSDPDGSVSSYAWTKVSGPTGSSFATPTQAGTSVSGLVQGTYVFRLTVTDNQGATGTDDVSITINPAPSASANWLTGGNSNTDTTLHYIGTNDAQPLIFKTNGVKQARLTTDGVFTVKKLRVTQSAWADYVFDSTYKLRSLEDVENYITANKHLPGVASEKEIASKGMDVGDNQAVLLQKIEELTLYMIQINKKVEKLKKENASLKKQLKSRKK